MSKRESVMAAVEKEMRSRTYDRHAHDKEVFMEGVADIADAAIASLAAASFGDKAAAWDEGVEAYRSRYERDESLPLTNPYR